MSWWPWAHRRRLAPHSDRRAPFKQLLGWASATGLQRMADLHDGPGTWPISVSKDRSDTYCFPIYTEDPKE